MKKTFAAIAALGLFAAAPALAKDATEITGAEMLEQNESAITAVSLTGGVGGYLGQLSDFTGVGPVWGVNVNGDVTQGIGWELAYQGSRVPLDDERLVEDAAVWGNGLHGMAKVYVPMQRVKPFAGVGIGGSYLNVSDSAEGLFQNDWVTELPVAAGVEYRAGAGLTAGARAMYRFTAGEEFAAPAFAGESPEGGQLSAQLTLGGQF